MNFRELHQQKSPLLLGNVWDANSAQILEKLNFQALGTSSAAIANTLGYTDGEGMPFEEMLFMVKRIRAVTKLPLSVDMEAGYSREIPQILANIDQLLDLGIVGINFEDTVVGESRKMIDADDFAARISAIKNHVQSRGQELFINARTDAFLIGLNNPMEETLKRIHKMEQAGADGIFVPKVVAESDIETVVNATRLPVNVLGMPGLPGFHRLQELGVKRVSMGSAVFRSMLAAYEGRVTSILERQSFDAIF